MTKEERAEALRRRLAREFEETEWEWNFASEIVLVAKEMGVDTDELLDWTIMKFDVIRNVIAEFYKKQAEAKPTGTPVTLG
jgi:hypothetical protein